MPEGIITYFNEKKGYGFISSDEHENIYVHFSSIMGRGYKVLQEGQRVLFELQKSEEGLEARNVRSV